MTTQSTRSLCLIVFPALSFALFHQSNYGYVGPACAVADGRLFLHGEAQRELTSSENDAFRHYQRDLNIFLELKKKFPILEPPKMPSFCGSLNDAAELVLKGCIVREGKVFIDNKMVRVLTDDEEMQVDSILGPWSRRRVKRDIASKDIKEPGFSPLRDISIFLDRFLKINPTVTKRFAPWFEQSPLVSGREPIPAYGPSFYPTNYQDPTPAKPNEHTTVYKYPLPPKPIKPGRYGVKRRPTSRWDAKFSKNHTSTNKPGPIHVSNYELPWPRTSTSSPEESTTTAQTLLQLLAKSLTDPELVKTLTELERSAPGVLPVQSYTNKEGTPTPQEPDYLPNPVVQWFARTVDGPNSVNEHLSFLPDEICTAHMKRNAKRRNVNR
ncbi:pepsin inhibitor-3-like repeated domain protein [Ancylostoma caninum]|uniref:Pepsin inhibitor-3-like repeated domain protein n=1 Tax=Ancylostoma caninum TaxID=29170 RepID=A0A368H8H4_ANCCA|nr:pepsin inhibitor-3-like repeated domain protein [Ancylostoma caninum]